MGEEYYRGVAKREASAIVGDKLERAQGYYARKILRYSKR